MKRPPARRDPKRDAPGRPGGDRPGASEAGFSAVAALFLLVVLAALGTFILSVSSTQHVGQAYDVQGSRAYQASRAGIEWGLYQVLQAGVACPATTSFVPPAIADFTVTVGCSSSSTDELGTAVTVYALTATACNRPAAGACPGGTGDGYVERQITATAAR